MTNEERLLLEKFKHNVYALRNNYDLLKQENEELQAKLSSVENKLNDLEREKQSVMDAYDNLKIAGEMSISAGDKDLARKRINKMVREIDKCIALLNV